MNPVIAKRIQMLRACEKKVIEHMNERNDLIPKIKTYYYPYPASVEAKRRLKYLNQRISYLQGKIDSLEEALSGCNIKRMAR